MANLEKIRSFSSATSAVVGVIALFLSAVSIAYTYKSSQQNLNYKLPRIVLDATDVKFVGLTPEGIAFDLTVRATNVRNSGAVVNNIFPLNNNEGIAIGRLLPNDGTGVIPQFPVKLDANTWIDFRFRSYIFFGGEFWEKYTKMLGPFFQNPDDLEDQGTPQSEVYTTNVEALKSLDTLLETALSSKDVTKFTPDFAFPNSTLPEADSDAKLVLSKGCFRPQSEPSVCLTTYINLAGGEWFSSPTMEIAYSKWNTVGQWVDIKGWEPVKTNSQMEIDQ